MRNLACEIAKYLILFFMLLYVIKCFTIPFTKDRDKKNFKLNVQVFYIFLIHAICYAVLYLRLEEREIIIFYIVQVAVAILYMVIFRAVYKNSSRLLINNTMFMLLVGYTMLTRIDTDLAHKQFYFATICLFITMFIPYIMNNYRNIKEKSTVLGVVGIFTLLTVFVPGVGMAAYGSRNWIKLGSITLQPMEFVKIIFVFYLASKLVEMNTISDLFRCSVFSAVFMGILFLENDLGACLIFYITFLFLVYVATGRSTILILGFGLLIGAILFGYVFLRHSVFAHVMTRIYAWQDPFKYIDGSGYQVSQSLFAIGTGGYTGAGLTKGLVKTIPVRESDFIFSAICEELGVIFGLALILVCLSIFISFVNVSMRCNTAFYKYVSFGYATIYIIQTLLNIGGVTKFIPSTGVTLPLVSYGVSSVSSTLVIFAIIQGVYVITNNEVIKSENKRRQLQRQTPGYY